MPSWCPPGPQLRWSCWSRTAPGQCSVQARKILGMWPGPRLHVDVKVDVVDVVDVVVDDDDDDDDDLLYLMEQKSHGSLTGTEESAQLLACKTCPVKVVSPTRKKVDKPRKRQEIVKRNPCEEFQTSLRFDRCIKTLDSSFFFGFWGVLDLHSLGPKTTSFICPGAVEPWSLTSWSAWKTWMAWVWRTCRRRARSLWKAWSLKAWPCALETWLA